MSKGFENWTAAAVSQLDATRDIAQGQKVAYPERGGIKASVTFEKGTTHDEAAELLRQSAQQRTQALGRMPAGKMNGTEKAYSNVLEARKMAGEILWYAFEPINIRLAPKCFFKVDFMIQLANGVIECHETKGGFMTDDSLVKIKVAAELLPFQFCIMKLEKGVWIRRDF